MLDCYQDIFLWPNHYLPFDLLKDLHVNLLNYHPLHTSPLLKINALKLLYFPTKSYVPVGYHCDLSSSDLNKSFSLENLQGILSFSLSFPFSWKTNTHGNTFPILKLKSYEILKTLLARSEQSFGEKPGVFLKYFQWYPRICQFLLFMLFLI